MADIVIYGGTFNPIHNGHVGVCRYVLEQLGFHKVLLIPAASPPHKDAPELAPGTDRLAICRLAARLLPSVEVLDWELLRGGRSYTIDTVTYLSQQYPNDRLFLLMGSDMFLTFRQWRQWRDIGKYVTLLVASRETDDRQQLIEQQQSLCTDGITSQVMKNPVTTLSSTEVRRVLAEGGGEGLVPTEVLNYIRQQGLYGCGYSLAQLRETAKSLMNPQRYYHSICVERQAVHLAQLYGGDKNKAAAAAILHDICKNMPNDHLLQMLKDSDTIVNIDFSAQPQLLHSYAGAVYIQDRLGITDDDIINAVRYHTTARAGMSLLERIVYLADLTSEERNYPDVAVMRSLADSSLNEAMRYALEYIVQDLKKQGLVVCEYTTAALAEYRKNDNKE